MLVDVGGTCVSVGVGGTGVSVDVGVAVGDTGVSIDVGTCVLVGVDVGVGVAVAVGGTGVLIGIVVCVGVAVGVDVTIGVGVNVGVGELAHGPKLSLRSGLRPLDSIRRLFARGSTSVVEKPNVNAASSSTSTITSNFFSCPGTGKKFGAPFRGGGMCCVSVSVTLTTLSWLPLLNSLAFPDTPPAEQPASISLISTDWISSDDAAGVSKTIVTVTMAPTTRNMVASNLCMRSSSTSWCPSNI